MVLHDSIAMLGWTVDLSNFNHDTVFVYDHTSFFDFWIIILSYLLSTKINFLIQPKIYDVLIDWFPWVVNSLCLMRAGSIEQTKCGTIQILKKQLKSSIFIDKHLAIAISPKGTTCKTDSWRSGYITLAKECNMKVQAVIVDWVQKTLTLGPAYDPNTESLEEHLRLDLSKGVPLIPANSDAILPSTSRYDPFDVFLVDYVLLSNLSWIPLGLKLWMSTLFGSKLLLGLHVILFYVSCKYHGHREQKFALEDKILSRLTLISTIAYALAHQSMLLQNTYALVTSTSLTVISYIFGCLYNDKTCFTNRKRGPYAVWHSLFHISMAQSLYYIL